jgi:hypothetical protein
MKVVILYRPNSEQSSSVEAYVREFTRQTGRSIEMVNVDSVQGLEMAKLHDIMMFPAIIVLRDNGSFVQSWLERDKWPTVSELSFYNQ